MLNYSVFVLSARTLQWLNTAATQDMPHWTFTTHLIIQLRWALLYLTIFLCFCFKEDRDPLSLLLPVYFEASGFWFAAGWPAWVGMKYLRKHAGTDNPELWDVILRKAQLFLWIMVNFIPFCKSLQSHFDVLIVRPFCFTSLFLFSLNHWAWICGDSEAWKQKETSGFCCETTHMLTVLLHTINYTFY